MDCIWWILIVDVGLVFALCAAFLIVVARSKVKQLTREAYHTGHREKDIEN